MTVSTKRAFVQSFAEIVSRPFGGGVNALCWPRNLEGDFAEVAQRLAPSEGFVVVEARALEALSLSAAGRVAANVMLEDLRRLAALGYDPVLNCITTYESDERGLPIATDLMSFHVDRSPIEVDTWLCTYYGRTSEGLDNGDARRLVDVPVIRAGLLDEYGGQDDGGFAEFLSEGSFDLHYGVLGDARPFAFGVGNLWRIAVAWPGCAVPPCIHRAPRAVAGDVPRLLLIC